MLRYSWVRQLCFVESVIGSVLLALMLSPQKNMAAHESGLLARSPTSPKHKEAKPRMEREGVLGNRGVEVIPILIRDLKHATADVRANAAYQLGTLGSLAKAALPPLITALEDNDETVRLEVAIALGKVGDAAIPSLVKAVSHKSLHTCLGAIDALGAMGPRARVARLQILKALKNPRTQVRAHSVQALAAICEAEAVPTLVAVLEGDVSIEVRVQVASALANIRPPADKAIPTLLKVMKLEGERYSDLHLMCSIALRQMGSPAVLPLASAARDPSNTQLYRLTALYILRRIGKRAKDAIPTLTILLHDKDERMRRDAIDTLGHIGARARVAIPELERLAITGTAGERALVGAALYKIDATNKRAVPLLIEALTAQDPAWRHFAANALGDIDPSETSAIPALLIALKDKKTNVRISAAYALGHFGTNAKKAITDLQAMLLEKDDSLRRAAEYALKSIGM